MPTNNPRVSITLSRDDLAVLDRFSAAIGSPRATVLAGLVSSVLPQLAKATELIELANAAPRHVQESLAEGVRVASEQAMGKLEARDDVYGGLLAKLQRELPIDKPRSRGVKGAGAPARSGTGKRRPDPHLLTGGSK